MSVRWGSATTRYAAGVEIRCSDVGHWIGYIHDRRVHFEKSGGGWYWHMDPYNTKSLVERSLQKAVEAAVEAIKPKRKS
jgi:hypothetical protein